MRPSALTAMPALVLIAAASLSWLLAGRGGSLARQQGAPSEPASGTSDGAQAPDGVSAAADLEALARLEKLFGSERSGALGDQNHPLCLPLEKMGLLTPDLAPRLANRLSVDETVIRAGLDTLLRSDARVEDRVVRRALSGAEHRSRMEGLWYVFRRGRSAGTFLAPVLGAMNCDTSTAEEESLVALIVMRALRSESGLASLDEAMGALEGRALAMAAVQLWRAGASGSADAEARLRAWLTAGPVPVQLALLTTLESPNWDSDSWGEAIQELALRGGPEDPVGRKASDILRARERRPGGR